MSGTIGVIGGTGLYEMDDLENRTEVRVNTPFGLPSAPFIRGELGGTSMVFLPRHGRGHRILPTDINNRANIFGMKLLGVERIISVSAVGSLQQRIKPGHIVLPDQFIDRTSRRPSTFFGEGIVAHVAFADPVCALLREALCRAAGEEGQEVHSKGTYICIEGPQFSTRAESHLYRSWGAHVIGMTNLQEAKLAREAELCFATLALATDYDCWNESAGDVDIEQVIRLLTQNVATAQRIIRRSVGQLSANRSCSCATALRDAIVTDQKVIPRSAIEKLGPLVGKYLQSC